MTPQILRALFEKDQEKRKANPRDTIPSPRARKAGSITGPRKYL